MKISVLLFTFLCICSFKSIAQPGANLCFQDEWFNEGERFQARGMTWDVWFINEQNNLGMTREEIANKVKITLERLPTSHLRIVNEIHIVVGKPCKGGGSRKCASNPERAGILLSYESFRDMRARPTRYRCSGRNYTDKGAWDEEKQTHGTLLHEIGHHIDYKYSITNGLPRHEREDFRTCVNTNGCYSKTAKTRGISEVTAQAYYAYFNRTTYQQVMAGSTDGSPRSGTQPATRNGATKLFNQRRLNVLLSSDAWESWD